MSQHDADDSYLSTNLWPDYLEFTMLYSDEVDSDKGV